MQTYQAIQAQIGAWSRENFGDQETPYLAIKSAGTIRTGKPRAKSDVPGNRCPENVAVVCLDGIAPLMGIMEEVGELVVAESGGSKTDMRDAVGDIAIYLCDYLAREGVEWPAIGGPPDQAFVDARDGMVAHLGQIYRGHLKRFQRIRDFENDAVFEACREDMVYGFAYHLAAYTKAQLEVGLLEVLNETWNNIVKKRDWRDDAVGGGGHTHTGAMG